MKTFNNIKKLNVFIVLVLVVLLAGIATTIYANEDTKQGEDEAKKEKEIKLEPGEEGKEYCKKIHDPKSQENINWKIQESEKLNLPEGLQLIDNKILCGTPTKVGVFIFTLNGMKSDNKNVTYKISLKIRPKINFSQSENLRFITGFEISRASCTSGGEKGFVDLYFSQPLPFSFNKERGKLNLHPFGVWGNIRFSSIPQQNTKNIGTEHSELFSTLSDLKLDEMTQSAEFLVGIEYNIGSIKSTNNGYNYILGLIAAYGGSTPMVSGKNPQLVIFKKPMSDDQLKLLKDNYDCTDDDLSKKNYISFAPEDRDRFFHQAYLGIRLKSYMNEAGALNLPATFDVTYGFNDAASGGNGKLFTKKSVLRFDGFLPIKILEVPIYIFGTVFINTSKGSVCKPLILGEPVDESIPSNSNELLILIERANKRDYFKIGIGVDIYKLFKTGQENNNKKLKEVQKQLNEEKVKKEDLEEIKEKLTKLEAIAEENAKKATTK